jgi:[ribosomal protein S5]-alanine N-acetyltransferase
MMRTLHAPGLTLEPQTAAHASAMFDALNDVEVHTYLDDTPPVSVHALRERFARLETRCSADGSELWLNWALRLDDGAIAGYVQATVLRDGSAWIAYLLGRAHWGRGHATRAVCAMIDELVNQHRVTQLLATADRDNRRSIALLGRLGFTVAPDAWRRRHDVLDRDVLLAWASAPAGPAQRAA